MVSNPHWVRVVGFGQFSLCVIHKEGLCPCSGDVNRVMMMMIICNMKILAFEAFEGFFLTRVASIHPLRHDIHNLIMFAKKASIAILNKIEEKPRCNRTQFRIVSANAMYRYILIGTVNAQ
jgi:hypothetical protein